MNLFLCLSPATKVQICKSLEHVIAPRTRTNSIPVFIFFYNNVQNQTTTNTSRNDVPAPALHSACNNRRTLSPDLCIADSGSVSANPSPFDNKLRTYGSSQYILRRKQSISSLTMVASIVCGDESTITTSKTNKTFLQKSKQKWRPTI